MLGQMWICRITTQTSCYQSKMSNKLSGSVVVNVEFGYLQMCSICLAAPLTPLTKTYQGGCVPRSGQSAAVLLFYFTRVS